MKGFKLSHNKRVVTATIKHGVTCIFLNYCNGSIYLDFNGLDSKENKRLKWYSAKIEEGDAIQIEVLNVENSAEPIEATPVKTDTLQDKLREYYNIKEYLEKEGLLKKD